MQYASVAGRRVLLYAPVKRDVEYSSRVVRCGVGARDGGVLLRRVAERTQRFALGKLKRRISRDDDDGG